MKKVKGPAFTYPRKLAAAHAAKNELLARRLWGRGVFTFEFTRLLQNHFAGRAKLSILEIATGSGEFARLMVDLARNKKRDLRVTAIDFEKTSLDKARSLSKDYPEIDFQLHSAAGLEDLRTAGYDLVTCTFALHLFPIDKAIALLKAIERTATDAWMVTDYRRSRWLTMFAEAVSTGHKENRQGLTEAVSLTQQSFSGHEVKNLAFHAGIADYEWRPWSLLHQSLIRVK